MRNNVLLAVLTLLVAGAWYWGTGRIAAHVGRANLARLLAGSMAGSAVKDPVPPPITPGPLPFIPAPPVASQPVVSRLPTQQFMWAEGAVVKWERAMRRVALFLIIAGVLSFERRLARWVQLLAAVVILASAAGTLILMQMLMDPARGGLPRLSHWTFILVGLVQSLYGLALLFYLGRRARRPAAPVLSE